jgi:hypothetical protein
MPSTRRRSGGFSPLEQAFFEFGRQLGEELARTKSRNRHKIDVVSVEVEPPASKALLAKNPPVEPAAPNALDAKATSSSASESAEFAPSSAPPDSVVEKSAKPTAIPVKQIVRRKRRPRLPPAELEPQVPVATAVAPRVRRKNAPALTPTNPGAPSESPNGHSGAEQDPATAVAQPPPEDLKSIEESIRRNLFSEPDSGEAKANA